MKYMTAEYLAVNLGVTALPDMATLESDLSLPLQHDQAIRVACENTIDLMVDDEIDHTAREWEAVGLAIRVPIDDISSTLPTARRLFKDDEAGYWYVLHPSLTLTLTHDGALVH